jgi:hypothetical protein
MKNRRCETRGWFLLITLIVVFGGISRANAQAINDIQVIVSGNDVCDGSVPSPKSFVVYAQNKNSARPISATFQYDSNPSSQSFQLYDASLSPYTDRFPKSLVIRIAPGATVPIGCTDNYRPSTTPASFTTVPIIVTLTGAAYVNPGQAYPPPEDARAFAAFLLQGGFSACPSGGRPQGLFYFLNLHPYARLRATVNLFNGPPSQLGLDLAPVSLSRAGCSNGSGSPKGAARVGLVYPPGQKGSHKESTAAETRKKVLSSLSAISK